MWDSFDVLGLAVGVATAMLGAVDRIRGRRREAGTVRAREVEPRRPLTVWLDRALGEALAQEAERAGVPAREVADRALRAYLQR
jgi:hypothetical protein